MAEKSVAKKCKLPDYARSRKRKLKVSPSSSKKCKNRSKVLSSFTSHSATVSPSCSQDPECVGTGSASGTAFTPLEEQVLQLKKQHPGLVLMVQNAYMYMFFGEDAEVAADVLKVTAYWSQNFLVAVVPITRLSVHVHRLVQAGYKVGVVNQTGACNAKPRHEKHSVFQRQLISVYSKATLVGDDADFDYTLKLMSIMVEICFVRYLFVMMPKSKSVTMFSDKYTDEFESLEKDHKCVTRAVCKYCHTSINMAFDPATCDAVCDEFTDCLNRVELDKRLEHLQPVEVLVSEDVSENTARLLNHRGMLMEKLPSSVFKSEASFSELVAAISPDAIEDSAAFQMWNSFHPVTLSCVAVLSQHLKKFDLHAAVKLSRLTWLLSEFLLMLQFSQVRDMEESNLLAKSEGFRRFSVREQYLQMDGSTLRNLEILSSKANTYKGSLCWVLDQTVTKFGTRLLRDWVSKPLRDLSGIRERQEAVQELVESRSDFCEHLKKVLADLPDIERGLAAILNFKCSPWGVCVVLESLNTVRDKLQALLNYFGPQIMSELLKRLVEETFQLLVTVNSFLRKINKETARSGEKRNLLLDYSGFPCLLEQLSRMAAITRRLDALKLALGDSLRMQNFQYTSVSGQEYLIEAKIGLQVPGNWRVISQTKTHVRYRTPEVDTLYSEWCQLQEDILPESQKAWLQFLQTLNEHFFSYKTAVRNLAAIDVLFSFAKVAKSNDYCRPSFVNVTAESMVQIDDGRHPIMEQLPFMNFVANSTNLKGSECRCMTLSGPNMGGKSSYIRQVALLAIMAHVGSFVPAKSAAFSVLDAVYSRMGAEDQLLMGRSTLMVELQETSDILRAATARSLVLVDELGRGTGSSDGTSLSWACLRHLVTQVKCLTLFVTHYPVVMQLTESLSPLASNYHVEFFIPKTDASPDVNNERLVILLYSIKQGLAEKSFGLNAAQLAGIPETVLNRASMLINKLVWNASNKRHVHEMFKRIILADDKVARTLVSSSEF